MKKISLNGEWKAVGISPDGAKISITGNVPGSALNDIILAGIEENATDIFFRNNTDLYKKYEKYSWIYTKSFSSETKE